MNAKRFLPLFAGLALAVLASACTQKNTDDQPNTTTDIPSGLNRFLLFPNPLAMSTGGFETNTGDYADAYYRAIDPNNDKDTIDKWKTQNGFGGGTGTELLAVFRDAKDLGYGRRMTGRKNTDGSIAFYVENYNVTPNASSGGYSSILNVEAAIRRDTRWHVGTNAIEWSTASCSAAELAEGCNPNIKFAKYYNFSSKDGTRQLAVDLDGNGLKAMPGPCITCHGGRGDPLTPPDAANGGKPRFPLVENSVSRKRGDVQAKLHGMNVDSFGYSPDIAGFSKTDQQATLRTFNQWILCTYPLPAASALAEDACRVPAGPNEWQGTAAELIKAWYGGPGMPNGIFQDSYVPAGWAGNPSLYTGVVAPYCRTCHILRGTKNQDDIDFTKLGTPAVGSTPATGFQSYADRIKAHVFDRGTMPLALIVYDAFWSSDAPNQLATYINPLLSSPQTVLDASGAALKPGRPIASPGPNRMVRTGANAILTGEDSLFASSYSWTQISSNPAGLNATISDPGSMITLFNAPQAGDYVMRLTVSNGSQTDSKDVTLTASDVFPDPISIKFAHVKNALQNITYTTSQVTAQKCVTCHVSPPTSPTPPIFYNSVGFDRNGDGVVDATDDAWFLKALQGRINLTEIEASPLLRKPSGNHHKGLMVLDVADKSTGGGLSSYSILYHWILAGAPGGGVAANALVNGGTLGTPGSPVLFTFSGPVGGPYASPNITLDGSSSLGPLGSTTYAWTVFGPPGPLGTPPSIANQNAATTTLNVFDVGTYVVQLQVSDGVSTDTVQQTIVIGENPITASFSPATGTQQVTFANSPLRGSIALTSTSAGNPTTCRWQIFGPAGATLGTFPTIVTDLTQSCGSAATLTAPLSSIGSSYTVQLTASNLASSTADNFIVINAAAGQTVGNAAFTFPGTNAIRFTINNNTANATQTVINGVQTNSIQLTGSATGQAPLNYAWSISGANTAGCQTPAAGQITSLVVSKAGTCDVTLTVTNSFPGVASVTHTVTVQQTVTFNNSIKGVLGNGAAPSFGVQSDCTGCHVPPGTAIQPNWQTDGSVGQDNALRSALQTKIDTTTPRNSLIVNCPTFGCDFNGSFFLMPAGHAGFLNGSNMSNYDAFLTWIINGQP
jgi:K319-like protein